MTIAFVKKAVARLFLCAMFAFVGIAAGHGGGTIADVMLIVLGDGDIGEPISVWSVLGVALVLCSILANQNLLDNVLVIIGCACQSIALSIVLFSSYAHLLVNVTLGLWLIAVVYVAYNAIRDVGKGRAVQEE